MAMELTEAWQRYFPPLRAKCQRVLGDSDEANDVAQETFIRFWQAKAAVEPQLALPWLYRTATHLAVDRLRQRAMRERGVPGARLTPDLEVAASSRQQLAQLSAKVDEQVLRAAVLSRLDGLTQPEVADVLGLSERTVRRLLTRFDEVSQAERAP